DHVGPMTRNVEDNAITLAAIAGHDPSDPTSTTRPFGDCLGGLKASIKGLRIGVIEHFYTTDAPADPEQVRGITAAIDVLRRLGADVRTIKLAPLTTWRECNRTIHQAESYTIHERDMQERPQDYARITLDKTLSGAFISASKYIKAQQLRRTLCQEFAEAMP